MTCYSTYISVLERHKEKSRKKHFMLPSPIYLRVDGRPAHWPEGFWGVGVLE